MRRIALLGIPLAIATAAAAALLRDARAQFHGAEIAPEKATSIEQSMRPQLERRPLEDLE